MQVLKNLLYRDNNFKQIMLVWTCTENGRKQKSQKSIIYEFWNKKIERQTKKYMARWDERGWKNSWWGRVAGKST